MMSRFTRNAALMIAGALIYETGRRCGYLGGLVEVAKELRTMSHSRYNHRRSRNRTDNEHLSTPRFASPLFDTKEQAEDVLTELDHILGTAGRVSAKNLNYVSGMDSTFQMGSYGWLNLNDAGVMMGPDGYRLKLPKPVWLD